jgi:ribosomal-protein-alanine N-acetyltransferase
MRRVVSNSYVTDPLHSQRLWKNIRTNHFTFGTMYLITETEHLIIREFFLREEEIYLNHFTDDEVCRYIPQRTRPERVNIFLAALVNYISNKQQGIWGIFNKANEEFVGSCLLRIFDNEPGRIELGYSLEQKYWGQGIATEMAAAMIAYAFTDENTNEVVAVTDLDNIASQRVLEKAGLVRGENLLRDGEELAFFSKERH